MNEFENQASEVPENSAEVAKVQKEVQQIRQKLSHRLIAAMGQKDEQRIRDTTEEIQQWDFDTAHFKNVDEMRAMVERKRAEMGK